MGHTLVDLPKNLDRAVLDRLKDTRISGQLINIAKDTGRPPRRDGDDRGGRGGRGGYRDDRRGGRGRRDDRGGRGGRRGGWRD